MAESYNLTASSPNPKFPEDIERIINDMVLNDDRDMCGTMSLLASRFYAWTKPITFSTVIVRQRNNWTERIKNLLLPIARFIQILAIDLPFTRGLLSAEELSLIRRLLETSGHVRHLAVVWHIWADFHGECGSLPLKSLYLIWDGAFLIRRPRLQNLRHPSTLKDLTIYAPPDLHDANTYHGLSYGENLLPETEHCENLDYVAYAAECPPIPPLCEGVPHIKGVMFVNVDVPKHILDECEDPLIVEDMELWPHFSTAYVRYSSQVLGEWVAKIEGKRSILYHPPLHTVEYDPDVERLRQRGVSV